MSLDTAAAKLRDDAGRALLTARTVWEPDPMGATGAADLHRVADMNSRLADLLDAIGRHHVGIRDNDGIRLFLGVWDDVSRAAQALAAVIEETP